MSRIIKLLRGGSRRPSEVEAIQLSLLSIDRNVILARLVASWAPTVNEANWRLSRNFLIEGRQLCGSPDILIISRDDKLRLIGQLCDVVSASASASACNGDAINVI